jgi:hypothetical protein
MRTPSKQLKLVEWGLDTPALLLWLNTSSEFGGEGVQIINAWFTEPYTGDPHHVALTLVFFHEALGAVPAPGFEFHPDALSTFLFPLSE